MISRYVKISTKIFTKRVDNKRESGNIVLGSQNLSNGRRIHMIDSKVIGERLRSLRGERSRAEVAKEAKISVSALAMYEIGERIPRDEVKVELARIYNRTVESIFFT